MTKVSLNSGKQYQMKMEELAGSSSILEEKEDRISFIWGPTTVGYMAAPPQKGVAGKVSRSKRATMPKLDGPPLSARKKRSV